MAKVLVAMSGGVDSSATALILKREGHDVAGITMSFDFSREGAKQCFSPDAVSDAKAVCDQLDIPHYTVAAANTLQNGVINDFINEYRLGRTPNPCVRCNQRLKFGLLYEKMKELGYEFLATGHYASVIADSSGAHLTMATDKRKDQTYFLWGISKEVLAHVMFPACNLEKRELRAIAVEAGLVTATKKESQDICFVPDGNYRKLLADYGIESKTGDMVTTDGTAVGKHQGIEHYTVGQRKGLGVALGYPAFVVEVNRDANVVVVGERRHLEHAGAIVGEVNFLEELPDYDLSVKFRSTMSPVPCSVVANDDLISITFDEPQFAVSAGQSAVLYNGETVVAGGIIQQRL